MKSTFLYWVIMATIVENDQSQNYEYVFNSQC